MNPITLDSLPYELKLDIIEILYDLSKSNAPRIMAVDTAWAKPYYQFSYLQQRPSADIDSNGKWPALKALRLVSRQYHEMCTPLLYQELNLDIIHCHTAEELQEILRDVVNPYGQNVRSVRIHLGHGRGEWHTCTEIMGHLLSKCTNATTLALYYRDGTEPPFGELADQIVRMMESNQIVRFGLFSSTIMKTVRSSDVRWSLPETAGPIQMLDQIFRSSRACQALQRLDLAMEEIPNKLFMFIRSNLTELRSLTIRRALRFRLPGFFDTVWPRNDYLTSLNLMGCNSAHAAQMPLVVKHFLNLQELVWATCGHYNDLVPAYPKAGWSKDPTSLPHLRRPLKLLVLEHALEWEICVMGVIPAEIVIVTHPEELRLTRSMRRRVEMFPGMKILKVLPGPSPNDPQSNELTEAMLVLVGRNIPTGEALPTLDSLCEDLGVVLSEMPSYCILVAAAGAFSYVYHINRLHIFLTVRLGLFSLYQEPLQAQRIKEKHKTVKRLN